MQPEEFETRNALLDHFSSRASDHVTQLLTIALIGLTLIEARPPPYVLVIGVPAVLVVALWVAGRMVYWSYLSHMILLVPDALGKELAQETPGTRYFDPTLESWCLHRGAVEAVAQGRKPVSWFSSLTPQRLVTLCGVYLVLVALALILWVNHGF
jgi:hypothetical protein